MVDKVIEKILEAEREAGKIIADAHTEAREIELTTEGRLEAEREAKITEARARAEKIVRKAHTEGEAKAAEIEKAAEMVRGEMAAAAEKNFKAATDKIIARVLKEYGNS